MTNNILDVTKHKKFKRIMVNENYDKKSDRKLPLLIRLRNFDNDVFKSAIVKPRMPVMIGDKGMDDSDQEFNVGYDLYKKTKNCDMFNNINEFEYVKTVKNDTDLKL